MSDILETEPPVVASSRLVRHSLSRVAGWRMPDNTVKVARPTMWGNPYVIGMGCIPDATTAVAAYKWWLGSADWDAWLFSNHFSAWHETQGLRGKEKLAVHLAKLRGKNLACWCKQGSPCHADVLLELANVSDQATARRGL